MDEMMEVEDAGEQGGLTGAAGVWSVRTMTHLLFSCLVDAERKGGTLIA
jgi:hypothetical protein